MYFNVPRGYAALLDYLEEERGSADTFFRRLDMLLYAAAALPQSLWDRLERLGCKVSGPKGAVRVVVGPDGDGADRDIGALVIDRPGNIGVPVPGVEVRLVPVGEKLEIRVKGAQRHPGLFQGALNNRARPSTRKAGSRRAMPCALRIRTILPPGLLFDGRTAENFKLSSGTWVNVGTLRTAVIAAGAPVIEDAVITGHDRDEIGLLIFPSLAGLRGLCPHAGPEATVARR